MRVADRGTLIRLNGGNLFIFTSGHLVLDLVGQRPAILNLMNKEITVVIIAEGRIGIGNHIRSLWTRVAKT